MRKKIKGYPRYEISGSGQLFSNNYKNRGYSKQLTPGRNLANGRYFFILVDKGSPKKIVYLDDLMKEYWP